jgi:hypothetical protein
VRLAQLVRNSELREQLLQGRLVLNVPLGLTAGADEVIE